MKLFGIIVNFHSDQQVKRLSSRIKSSIGEVIVVDNNKINRGFAAGANLGIKKALATGAEAVLLLNPDVKISSHQISALAKAPGDIVSPVLTFSRHGQKIFDYGGKVNPLTGRTTHWENSQGRVDYVSGACMLVHRQVFAKIGFFDERFFLYLEDADFCLRAKTAGFKIAVAKDIVINHQITEHRDSRDRFKMAQNRKSNWLFISKWVPWYFKPVGYLYWLLLWLKTR